MCFCDHLGDRPIRILVDSGSSQTFISTDLATHCSSLQQPSPPLQVQVANGQVLTCSSFVLLALWSIQECQFSSDLKVLPLSTYDMILGLDWLETQSLMEVHWGQKWLQIQHNGSSVQPIGILTDLPAGAVLHMCASDSQQQTCSSSWPPEIQRLVQEFSSSFEQPSQLPPSRSCYHSIPLIPGAAPVYSQPYRFSPTIKDEVERQV